MPLDMDYFNKAVRVLEMIVKSMEKPKSSCLHPVNKHKNMTKRYPEFTKHIKHVRPPVRAGPDIRGYARPLQDQSQTTKNYLISKSRRKYMAFFVSAIDTLKVLVIALGAGLGVWGVINLLEGYGNDNPGAKSQGMKQLMAGGGVALIGMNLIPLLATLFN